MKLIAFLSLAIGACATVPVSAPGNLTVSDATLTWTDKSASETEFIVERKTGDEHFTAIASLPANTTTYHDPTAATPGTTYTYRILAAQSGNHWGGTYSNEASFTR